MIKLIAGFAGLMLAFTLLQGCAVTYVNVYNQTDVSAEVITLDASRITTGPDTSVSK